MSGATDGKTFSHFCLSLEGAVRWPKKIFDRQFKDCIKDDDGRVMSPAAAREKFQILLSKGIKLIPAGDCDNFDPYDKGCMGHPMPDNQEPPKVESMAPAPDPGLLFASVKVKRSYVERWLTENDGGSPMATWAAGLLAGNQRFWFDGSPCTLIER